MLIVAASTKFALVSLIVAVLPTFVLLSCCFGKKKRKSKMASISLNLDADKKRKKQAAPTINNPYVSKTTNKVSGLGPDDPDLDSKRLKNGDDKPATTKNKKEAGKPVVVAGPAGGVDVPPSPAGSVSLLSGKTQPSSTIKTAKSGRLNLGNKFNWAEQKRGNHPLGIPHFAAEEERHKESPHCIVAAAGHLENQQSMPRLFPKDSRHSHESYRIAGAKQPSESESQSTIRHEVKKAG